MANSGFGVRTDMGGWISGPGWYDRQQQRKKAFLAAHGEWEIMYVRSLDVHEASTGDKDSDEGLTIVQGKSLIELMDKLEARYPEEYPRATPDRYQEIQVKPDRE